MHETNILIIWLFALFGWTSISGSIIDDGDDCFTVVKKLSQFDEKFQLRKQKKNLLFKQASKPNMDSIDKMTKALKGSYSICGATADWVLEVFLGMEQRADPTKVVTGDSVIAFFNDQATGENGNKRWLYHFIIDIPGDRHVWVVEQMPPPAGQSGDPAYRVYQSYMGAYSLKAWLASPDDDEAERNKHIIVNGLTQCGLKECEQDVMHYDTEAFKLFKKLTEKKYKGFFEEIRDFSDKQLSNAKAVADFEIGWHACGQGLQSGINDWDKGLLVPKAAFDAHYIKPLAMLSTLTQDTTDGSKVMTEEGWLAHKKLFGTQTLHHYKNVPMNAVVNGKKGNELFVRAYALNEKKADQDKFCRDNGEVMEPVFLSWCAS